MLLCKQEAGDIARILDRQTKTRHDRGLFDDQFVSVVRRAGMIEVKYEWKIVFGVIFRTQVFFLKRAIGTGSHAGIQDPSDEIIVVVFFSNSRKVGGKIASHQ